MKKLLLILLCVPLLFLYNSCSTNIPNPNLEQLIIDKIWEVKDGEKRFYLDSDDGKLYTKDYLCDDFIAIGDYDIIQNSITYTYDSLSFQITKVFEIVHTFTSTEISCLFDIDSNSLTSIIYYSVDEVTSGCMDLTALNYDSLANCPDSCIYDLSNFTYVPDDNFEQKLIEYGYDSLLDNYVLTSNINTVTYLSVYNLNIADFTGIEDFTDLTGLNCSNNQLTSLDVSNNTDLTGLDCSNNQLTSLDVSNNTDLTGLNCSNNQLTSLDVSQNTALEWTVCSYNQLTILDVTNNTDLESVSCSNNQLTTLDVTQNTDLTDLWCSDNQLTTLDLRSISISGSFSEFHCHNNQLVELYIPINLWLNFWSSAGNPNLYCIEGSIAGTTDPPSMDPQQYFDLDCQY